jgi:hypothetical protein
MLAKQVLGHLSHSTSPVLVLGIFKIGTPELFGRGWLQTSILLTSVVMITGVSHQWLLKCIFLNVFIKELN